MYIQQDKPTQNAYVERFNRIVRHEWLELHPWKLSSKHSYSLNNGFGHVITNDLIRSLAECRRGIY